MYAVPKSPALDGSSVLKCFEGDDAVKMCAQQNNVQFLLPFLTFFSVEKV